MAVGTYTADFADGQVPQQFVYDRDGFQLTTDVPAGYTYSQRFADIGDNGSTSFELTLTLDVAGTISFYRKVSSEGCCDKLRFDIDGVEQASYGGNPLDWAQVSFAVTAGTHTFRWRYTKDASVSHGSDTAWVTGIEVTNVQDPPPLHSGNYANVVHDFEDGLVPSGWTGNWAPSTTSPIAGAYSLKSDDIGDSQTTDMTWSYTPPENGVVHASMKVSSEAVNDKHQILVNGARTVSISGEASTVGMPIVRGGVATTVTHRYTKDISASAGSDTAWVDDVLQPWAQEAQPTEARLARQSAELLTTAPSDARLARQSAELLTTAPSDALLARISAELLIERVYPDAPAPRAAWDRYSYVRLDYSSIGAGPTNDRIIDPAQLQLANNEATDYPAWTVAAATADTGQTTLTLPFRTDLRGVFLAGAQGDGATFTANSSWEVLAGGSWQTLSSSQAVNPHVRPQYRDEIVAVDVNDVRAFRFSFASQVMPPRIYALHLYGFPSVLTHGLQVWHPTLDQPASGGHLNLGNVSPGSEHTRQFRIKNVSSARTANSVVVSAQSLTGTMADGVTFTTASTYTATIDIGNLAPEATSGVVTMKRTVPADGSGLGHARVLATPTSWT